MFIPVEFPFDVNAEALGCVDDLQELAVNVILALLLLVTLNT